MRDKDLETFERLFRDHYPRVLSFFLRKGFKRSDAEDLTQDTFHRVYKYVQSYRGGKESSYVLAVASSLWKNRLRRGDTIKRKAAIESMDASPPGRMPWAEVASEPLTGPPPSSPEQTALAGEREKILSRAIGELPRRHQRALKLRVQGCSYREIAAAMKTTPDGVRKMLATSRKRLRESPEVQATKNGSSP